MAWYILKTVTSMPPGQRSQGSRRWAGPFPDEQTARKEWAALISDGLGMTDLCIEEDPTVTSKEASSEPGIS